MNKFLAAIAIVVSMSCASYAGECRVQGNAGSVMVECTGTAYGQKAIPISELTSNPNENNVPEVCYAMNLLGFKSVFAIPCTNETVLAVNKKVDGFGYKAIVYEQKSGGPNFEPKIAISALYNADGTPATKLDYLKLVLSEKLDYPAYAGVWLPKRSYPPAMEYTWRKGTVIDKVATLKDGRIVNHVRSPVGIPMFSVERHSIATIKDVTAKFIVTPKSHTSRDRTGSSTHKKWEIPTEQSLRRDGFLSDKEELLRVVAIEEIQTAESVGTIDTQYETSQVFVTQERQIPQMSMTVFPYTE